MKATLLSLALLPALIACSLAQGSHWVSSYYTRNGTYVPGHYETNHNGTFYDNWSTKGNWNPYTGQPGWIKQPRNGYYDRNGVWHPVYRAW